MAVKIIGLKDNTAETLVPNQFSPSPIALTGTYQDITPNQILNAQGMCNIALWFKLSAGAVVDVKVKCYKNPSDTLTFEEGHSVFSIKTTSGISAFSEQNYTLTVTSSEKTVFQIPTLDLINNVKIFVKGSGTINEADITAQSRGA